VTRPNEERLREVFNVVERRIEERYGIPVRINDVPHPFTGDLDGAEIHVDHAEEVESALFIIAHLFGHTVQWNTSAQARDIGLERYQNPSDEQLADVRRYETEACRYSLQLFHDAGVRDLDQWVSDFAACDYAYLEHFYRTGQRLPFRSLWRDGQPLIAPLAIPSFTPTRWISRWEGVVV
jgi:hypothetical protein